MQKRIVVLGGVGFIGTHLCLRLLEEGHEVFCVDIRDAVNSPLLRGVLQHPLFRYVHHNIINGFSIRCDEIYNLASPSRVRYNKALPVETLRVSVLGAINALDTARTEHARVVFASAGNIYGIGQRDPASEPGNCCSTHYILCEGKRAAEALHRAYHSEYDVDTRIARIFNTYGPKMDINDGRVVSNFIVQALRNEPITIYGDGEQTRSFQYIDDLVEGMIRLMDDTPDDFTGPVNIGNPNEFTINELAVIVLELTGSKSKIVHMPLPSDDPQQRKPDISLARKMLNDWEPTIQLRDGLVKTIAYFEDILSRGSVRH